jgi:hypothetical protein
MSLSSAIPRRHFLRHITGAAGLAAIAGHGTLTSAQPKPSEATRVTQLLDLSPEQQQVSRDYSTGIRLAFAELGKSNHPVPELVSIETDGSAASIASALQAVKDDPRQVALVGTVGEAQALASLREASRLRLDIAHVAPWIADTQMDADPQMFALFASREDQIRQVLKSMASFGAGEIGIVYASPRLAQASGEGMRVIAERLRLRTRTIVIPDGRDVAAFAAALPASAPYFLVFMGGSIPLALFSQGLGKRGAQRYVVCLSDADANTFQQLTPGLSVPVVFTDVVPNPHSSKAAVVRAYRAALLRFFDEAPSSVSLAGYLAGRYAAAVLAGAGPNASRARVLAEFQRRRPMDMEGWRLEFSPAGRASSFVTQTLLSSQGNFVG